jgi:peptidoglycan/LPS O-acetylase OafA/YrhL
VALSFAVLIVSMRGRNITFFEKTHAFNKFFADFSYSLYLIHFPLMLFFLALISSFGSFPGIATGYSPTSIEGLGLYGLVIFLVYISSYAFSLLTERKTYQVKVKIRNVWEKF